MSDITKVSLDVLRVHPRNQEFFDDISGEDYEQFKASIKEDGIISELIVAPDMTILSGHQRYKAAQELGFTTVPVRIREDIATEEQKLKILLAANFGRKQNDKAKQRKVAAEYVALCGNSHGGDRKSSVQDEHLNYQEIAGQLGTSVSSLRRILRIERNLTEPVKQLLDDGIISETFAGDVIAGMTEDEQDAFVANLPATKRYTAKELKSYIDRIAYLENNPAVPADYEDAKKQAKKYKDSADNYKRDCMTVEKNYRDKVAEVQSLRAELDNIKNASPEEQYNEKLKNSCMIFCAKIADFIEKVGGYVWLTQHINELPTVERTAYIKAIDAVKSWALTMDYNITEEIK